MTTGRKLACLATATLAVVVVTWVGVDQVASYSAYRRLHSRRWRGSATSDETRLAAQQSLGWRFGSPHEAFIALQACGDESSVPHIRAALARRPSGSDSCVWAHGEEALDALGSKASVESRR